MGRVSLLGGAYSSRSLIASAQRCVNLFPEVTPETAGPPTPVTHLLTPGLTLYMTPAGPGLVRCIYRATDGSVYVVINDSVFRISLAIGAVFLGNIPGGATPVSMYDNGVVVVLVDGSASGWWWSLPTFIAINVIADPAFYGATKVGFLDGFFVFNRPNTNQFYLSPPFWDGVTAFDGTQIASKTGGPDPIVTIAVMSGNLWLIGQITTEVWFNSGAADFPFERQPGVFIEHGALARYGVATTDVNVIWLSQDRDGECLVLKGVGYTAQRISNHAVETAIQQGDNGDAIAFTYQQGGHTFYVLSLPTANQTWVYDFATGQWHERSSAGVGRWRVFCAATLQDQVLVGDISNGKIYTLDLNAFTENGTAITRTRSLPHLIKDAKRISYTSFIADLDVSQVPGGSQVSLSWSDDRGATFGNPVALTIANTFSSLLWRRLGMARDRVFELSWSFGANTAWQGAWVETDQAET